MSRKSLAVCWLWAVLLLRLEGPVTAILGTPEQKLRHDLLANYTVGVRPVLHPNDVLNISFSYRLSRVVSLDIKEQVLTTDAWIIQTWVNPYLSWNESQYGHIHTLHMTPDEVWVPDVVLYNNADETVILAGFKEKFKTFVIVDSKGENKWMSPATFKSSCDMVVRYYPFDRQKCEMTFGSWTYDSRLLKMRNPHSEHTEAEKYTESGDWELRQVAIHNVEKKYDCCDHPFSDVTYTLVFKRRGLYHVLYQILPCVFITLLIMVNFIIPAGSGERIGFCTTILLAMSVYLLILADALPETSDDIAILGLYYVLTMFMVALSLVGTAVVLRCHFGEKKPSNLLVKFSKFILRRNEKVSPASNHGNKVKEHMELSDVDKKELAYSNPALSDQEIPQNTKEVKEEQDEWKSLWKEISEAVDRFLLLTFVILTIIITLSVWLQQAEDVVV